MQWFKSAMMVSSAVLVAAMAGGSGCSSNGGQTDGGADVKSDKPITKPDSGGDSGPGCASGLACENCDVTGYTAVQQGKPVAMPGSCTAAQLQAFVTACFSSGASQATCTAWSQQDSGACGTCLAPVLQSSANWGPFDCATSSSPCGANSGGCVDLVTNSVSTEKGQGGAGSCGDLVTVNFGCQDYACGTCSTTDFQTCDQSATANECKSYVDAVTSDTGPCGPINGDAAPAKAQSCFPQTDADNVNFVDIFCGTGPTP